jgi:threonine/homoserine/homoserine lactone efflux protein
MLYDLGHWAAFLTAALLLNLAPGPDMAFILGHSVKGGTRAGTAAMLGIWAGASVHVALAALGLSAIIAASAMIFAAVKWIGVVYLAWIGWQSIRHAGAGFAGTGPAPGGGFWPVFRQGVLVDLLNPKVAIFFMAFLPQFVVEGAGPVWAQLALHGVLIIAVGALIEPPIVLASGWLAAKLRSGPTLGQMLDRALGTILIALAARLAFMDR